jgi:ABC-type sugar transport system substrate-binding protein
MRSFVLVMAISALLANASSAIAADAPATPAIPGVVVQLPDSRNNVHLYLFTLKKNGVLYKDNGAKFCTAMNYGRAIMAYPALAGPEDAVPDGLDWVICESPAAACPAPPAGSPGVSVQLPDSQDNFHVFLFTLKKNCIVYKHSGQRFCTTMRYGDAVLAEPASAASGDDVPAGLDWVICGFKNE